MDFSLVAKKLQDMLKAEIKVQGLYKTGKLYNSIKVTVDKSGNFSVSAEDYYTYLDEKHNITNNVLSSKQFLDYYAEIIGKFIQS